MIRRAHNNNIQTIQVLKTIFFFVLIWILVIIGRVEIAILKSEIIDVDDG